MTIIIAIIFIVGYLAIAFEHPLKINKAASALLTGVICWAVYSLSGGKLVSENLSHHLSEIAGILFFLLGSMVIVELIDAHDGFEIITERIRTTKKKKLVWIIGFITFFLSSVLNNLTTAIVMVSLVRKLVPSHKDRLMLAGLIVIAANAGGAWSPIGDVTTTMLWIGQQITPANIIIKTFIPSVICFVVPAFMISTTNERVMERSEPGKEKLFSTGYERKTVFIIGLGSLLFIPAFQTITQLPPYMGIIFGLGLMWVLTEMVHSGKDEAEKGLLSVNHALRKIDTPEYFIFSGNFISSVCITINGYSYFTCKLIRQIDWQYQYHHDHYRFSFCHCR